MVDLESAPFWHALKQHRLVLQRCAQCGRLRFPRLPSCPYCGSVVADDEEVAPVGIVYSWIRMHRTEDPYSIGVIELESGPRMLARLDEARPVTIGATAVGTWVDHPDWTELRFRVGAR